MKKIKNKKKIILLSATTLVVLAIIGGVAYTASSRNDTKNKDNQDGLTGVNYDPPTKEEKAAADTVKDKASDRLELEKKSTQNSANKKQVSPVISSTGQDQQSKDIEVAAFIPGVFEDGGTCTLSLSSGQTTRTATRTAIKNVSDTSCGFMNIPYSQLSPGSWQASVKYDSSSASGTSSSVEVKVK